MKAKEPRDRSASVRARLLNLARDRGEDFQITLRNYLFERFLYRLSRSELRERFVLKGAMLLRLWADQPYRATVDLDLLSRGNPDPDSVARDIAAICRTGVARRCPRYLRRMRRGPQIESPGTRARPTDTGMMSLQAPFSSGLRWSRN